MSSIPNSKYVLPFSQSYVKAGFPSPAQDYIESQIDIFEKLIKHPASTFLVRVKGDSMIDKGIQEGDILVVDKSLTPNQNSIVIAYIDGEFTVKRFVKEKSRIVLYPANDNYTPIIVNPDDEFLVWGVVTYVLHSCI